MNSRQKFGLLFWLTALVLAGCPDHVFAHDPGLSAVAIRMEDDRLEAVATFARKDVEGLLLAGGRIDSGQLQRLGAEVLVVEYAGRQVRCRDRRAGFDDQNNAVFHLTFATGSGGPLYVRSPLVVRLPAGHRQFLSVTDRSGRTVLERLLSANADTAEVERQPAPSARAAPSFAGFLVLGVEHILTGYDHLLFLFALLIVTRNFKSAVKIITCFTVAHSVSLAAATLDLVRFPATIVEPMIAASIVYVGVENLFGRLGVPASCRLGPGPETCRQDAGAPRVLRWRWLLTFAFGLIHGLGFASVLRDLGVGANGESITVPLAAFNLGVELGQMAVAALVLPVLWKLQAKPVFVRRWAPACSAAVVLAGGYWLVERM